MLEPKRIIKCPSCSVIWNTLLHNACVCGATLQSEQQERKYTEEDVISFADFLIQDFEMDVFTHKEKGWTKENDLCWKLAGTSQKYTTKEIFNDWLKTYKRNENPN